MSKKLITACLGVLALAAFVLPTAASASPVVTHPTGTKLSLTGQTCTTASNAVCLTGTNVGVTKLFATNGETLLLECSKAVFTGALTTNTGTHIEGDIHTATFTGTGAQDPKAVKNMPECTGKNGLPNATVTSNGTDPAGTKIDEEDVTNGTPWCITVKTDDTFTLRGGTCSDPARPIEFILHPTELASCVYSREAAVTGTIQTDTEAGKDATATVTPGAGSAFTKVAGGILCPQEGKLGMTITLETDKTTAEPLYIS